MPGTAAKNFNLPWHQHDQYWLVLYGKQSFSSSTLDALEKLGLQRLDDGGMGIEAPKHWKPVWDKAHVASQRFDACWDEDR